MNDFVWASLMIVFLAFFQNVSFSIVSRSRNRDNLTYHLIASVASNTIWFATFRQLILADMTWYLFAPYAIGTVVGSLAGAKVSMWIEKCLGATADGHVKVPSLTEEDVRRIVKEYYGLNEDGHGRGTLS